MRAHRIAAVLVAVLVACGLQGAAADRAASSGEGEGAAGPTPPDRLLFSIGGDRYPGELGLIGGVAAAADGTLYAMDLDHQRIVHVDRAGTILGAWGALGTREGEFWLHGYASDATMSVGIAVGQDGSVYVADPGNRRVQRFTADGTFLHAWSGRESGRSSFQRPVDVAAGPDGTVYVLDVAAGWLGRFDAAGRDLGGWWTAAEAPLPPCGPGRTQALSIAAAPDGTIYIGAYYERDDRMTSGCVTRHDPADGAVLDQWVIQDPVGRASPYPRDVVVTSGGDIVATVNDTEIQRLPLDGSSTNASFPCPRGCYGLAPDDAGGVWAGERGGIARMAQDGMFVGEILPKTPPPIGTFSAPSSVAVDRWGYVYVADADLDRVQRFDRFGVFAGQWGGHGAAPGQFDGPLGVATAPSSNVVFVADTGNHRIQVFSPPGRFLGAFGTHGSGDGELDRPSGVAVDDDNYVYVADTGNNRVLKFTAAGAFVASIGGPGSGDGELAAPRDLALDEGGYYLHVSDPGHHRLARYDASDGQFGGALGGFGGGDGQFQGVAGVGADPRDYRDRDGAEVYAVDAVGHLIQRFDRSRQAMMAWGGYGAGRGTLYGPSDVAVGPDGRVYVADTGNHRVMLLDAEGEFLDSWGTRDIGVTPPLPVAQQGEGTIDKARDVATAPDGGIHVVADDRVLRFGAEGLYLGQFGRRGYADDPDEWDQVVAAAVGPDGTVNVLAGYRGDTVQSFEPGGAFRGTWPTLPLGQQTGDAEYADIAAGPDGSLYAVGEATLPMQRFGPSGVPLGAWRPRVPGNLTDVAVGPAGDVYASGPGTFPNDRFVMERFAATGESLGWWGEAGSGLGQFGGACDRPQARCAITGLAVDADGTVYAGDPQLGRVQRFDRAGRPIDAVEPARWMFDWVFPGGRFDVDRRPGESRLVAIARGGASVDVFGPESVDGWRTELFGNRDLAERPLAVAYVPEIAFDWGSLAPGDPLPIDGFSGRFHRIAAMDPGRYGVHVTAGGGVRLWMDAQLVVDRWQDERLDVDASVQLEDCGGQSQALDCGRHDLLVEHRDAPGPNRLVVTFTRAADLGGPLYLPAARR